MADPSLRFERFDKARHNREAFDCGNEKLNDYFKARLSQHMRRGIAAGYVLARPDGCIAGYVTLSNGALPVKIVPPAQGYPSRLPLPTTLIGRLAVDREFQGRGIGGELLVHAFKVAVEAAQEVASAVFEVDAIDNIARGFYQHFGFMRLPDDETHLYLPMEDARKMVSRIFGKRA